MSCDASVILTSVGKRIRFPGLLGNVAAGRIANRLDLGGTNCVIDAACASSLGAINLAMLELAAGRCDLAAQRWSRYVQ